MTLTFGNENDVIVYALEKIICYARKHQYLCVAHSVWWIASVIGLAGGLATHIDNLRIRFEANQVPSEIRKLSSEVQLTSSIQDPVHIDTEESFIHPERILQVNHTVNDKSEVESSEPETERATSIIQRAKKFIGQSRKERQALKQKPCGLSRARSGKIPVKPFTRKQRNRLQAISKDTLSAYLAGRN